MPGYALSAQGRHKEALAAYEEAVRALLPFFQALPEAYADQMRSSSSNYLRACQKLGRAPDAALLEGVLQTLSPPER